MALDYDALLGLTSELGYRLMESGAEIYRVEESIRRGVKKALAGNLSRCRVELPETFTYEVTYKDWKKAYQMSFYPGMRAVDTFTNRLETTRWMDVVTAHCFVVY